MGELGTATRYEAFIRKGAKVNYRVEWHPGDGAPFLGPERFVKKMISKEKIPLRSSRRAPLKNLIKNVAVKSGLSAAISLRKGRQANVINARDQFIREAVFEQGYRALQVAKFLAVQCHSGAAEELVDLGKSVTAGHAGVYCHKPLVSLALHWRHFGKFGQCGIHMIPGLGAGCEDIQGRFIQARVIEASGRDHRQVRHSAGLSEQTGTTFRTKTAAQRIAAVRFCVVVLNRTRDLQRRGRQSDVRFVCTAACLLAIAAVAIPHKNRIGRTLVAHPTAKAASSKFSRHSFFSPWPSILSTTITADG